MCLIMKKKKKLLPILDSNVIYVMYKNFTKNLYSIIIPEKEGEGGIKYLPKSELTRQYNSNDLIGNQMHFLS